MRQCLSIIFLEKIDQSGSRLFEGTGTAIAFEAMPIFGSNPNRVKKSSSQFFCTESGLHDDLNDIQRDNY
jgi:hypothetical protein